MSEVLSGCAVRAAIQQEPVKTWRCFHCDEVFTDADEAREHFGYMEDGAHEATACQLTKDEKGLVGLLRAAWSELRTCHEEDTALHRSIWSLSADAETKRRDWGDKEYARGLHDGRAWEPLAKALFEIERDPAIKDQAWFDFQGKAQRILAIINSPST